jgi:hypothetical protein
VQNEIIERGMDRNNLKNKRNNSKETIIKKKRCSNISKKNILLAYETKFNLLGIRFDK